MTKITLVGVRPYEFVAERGKNAGQTISGFSYVGFLENGKPIKFTSRVGNYPIHLGGTEFSKDSFIEIQLDVDIQRGEVKYREHVEKPDQENL